MSAIDDVAAPGPSEAPTRSEDELATVLEAVLMVVDEPVPTASLASVLGEPADRVEAALRGLAAEYAGDRGSRARGFALREIGGGWRFYSAPDASDAVAAFVLDGQTARLTQAALETLAIVAYRQPISRGRIAAVRGVAVDGVVRTLLGRSLIEEAGHDEEGGAVLYRTTRYFLERFGLRGLEDLPPLAPYLPDVAAMDDLDPERR